MSEYGIATRLRIAAFIAQIGHESGQLRYVREILGPAPQRAGIELQVDNYSHTTTSTPSE